MRISPLTATCLGFALVLAAPAALAAKKVSNQHQKCAALDGQTITVTGTALGPTFIPSRDETNFMIVKGDSPCDAIDVIVKGPLDCGIDKRVRVEGKLIYDDNKIVAAHLDGASALCALPPDQAPATAAVPAGPAAPAPANNPAPPAPAAQPSGKITPNAPDFYKLQ